MTLFTHITHNIKVTATPHYLAEHSAPEESHYVWAYTIQLENLGSETVQLLNRYWHIVDAQGQVTEVRGAGVIGQQPVLRPGETFRYMSGTTLNAPSGIMEGSYEMRDASGNPFEIAIPAFSLDSPYQMKRMH